MDEIQKDQVNQESTGFEPTVGEIANAVVPSLVATVAPASLVEVSEDSDVAVEVEIPVLKLRHPQQVLTRNDVFILLSKKEEDMNEEEKGALKLFLLRTKNQNSRPATLTTKARAAKRAKRKASKLSRKANRS